LKYQTQSHEWVSRAWRVAALASAAGLAFAACGSHGSDGADGPRPTDLRAVDVARHAGISSATRTHGEDCVADVNNDGIPDLILSKHEQYAWPLYLGRRDGTFQLDHNVTFAKRDRHGCAVADFNGDGLLDVYMSIGGCKGRCTNDKELWIQQTDHSFTDKAEQWDITDPPARGRVPVVFDANADGRPDLFVGSAPAVDYPSYNRLWINRGDHFKKQTHDPVNNQFGNLCAAAADIDGDGHIDLAVCTKTKGLVLFRNKGGTFERDNDRFGLADHGSRALEFANLNGDRRPDLVAIGGKNVQVFLNANGRYGKPAYSEGLHDGRDVGTGDVDGDGDLDIFVLQGKGGNRVLLNAGDGRKYTPGPEVPSAARGVGDTVVAIPNWMGTGRAAFVVNNGLQDNPGPRQLIQFDKT
jgi:hypothetical protein